MASPKSLILAFDLYGTLLSTSSIAKELATHFGDAAAAAIATTWRTLQLEYSWRSNSMHLFPPFSQITHNALLHALRTHNKSLPATSISSLISAYDTLSAFPDVAPALAALSNTPDIHPVVFSNGTQQMVADSVRHSPDLAPFAGLFGELVTVDQQAEGQRAYKPAPGVYRFLAERVGKGRAEERGEVWLVSGNPFDVVGARAAGLQAAWVDREGNGWQDALLEGEEAGRPTIVVKGLDEVVPKVEAWIRERGG